ncbi:hypothetical protein A1Q1_04977 [Trichosporon asahii var. asahii CBS 2479]|uniref:DUF1349 domain-containing protein n=1 Tax=Trichosporon asahii var. asahii (strain ATCC 90039 / CBS 2479 / JCM 2466 / KCTC 7840 / NBRC 103889/ NCYC 2677 / UAMH 7654) TaxID=1186058 RepID=J5QB24_TRIAS|nr:hypothetical protein A1Q1_04977 [Trichosporon asahii var. asahii CBS 2479]EJT46428.1 hypothetical protein A1Q1_04977 [Trichosporon asahii var. asahii CBS 2479]
MQHSEQGKLPTHHHSTHTAPTRAASHRSSSDTDAPCALPSLTSPTLSARPPPSHPPRSSPTLHRKSMSADEVVVPGLPPLDWALKPGRAYVTQSSLFLEANGSTDWFCPGPSQNPRLNARPLGFSAPGTFALSAKVSIKGERSVYDAPALIVWRLSSPKRHWAKLCFEQAPALSPSPSPDGEEDVNGSPGPRDTGTTGPVSVVNHCDASDDASHGATDGEALYLRVSRTGSSSFAFHSSTDGRRWDLLRIFTLGGEGEIRAGFLAQCPTGSGCECRFEEIRLGQPPRNLRDGT